MTSILLFCFGGLDWPTAHEKKQPQLFWAYMIVNHAVLVFVVYCLCEQVHLYRLAHGQGA